MTANGQLGIVDWGIGGIGIYKLIKSRLGDIPIIYFSDTGVTPYGKMTRHELVSRLNAVVAFLASRGVTHLVIGCNAASTVIPHLSASEMKIEGVIESAVAMTCKLKPKSLGLIGGRRTVLSGVYRTAFSERGIVVKQRIAQPLSGLIESGDVSSQKLRAECRRILAPLKNCSHILLACTHYPAILSVLTDFVSVTTEFVDPSQELVRNLKSWDPQAAGNSVFFTSGDPKQMKESAWLAFNCQLDRIVRIEI